MFKLADKKLKEIGFIKVREDKFGAVYERYNKDYKFTQVVSLLHKASGQHIMQSCDKDLYDAKNIGNTCVGLTSYEMKWFYKKMKEIGLLSKKEYN